LRAEIDKLKMGKIKQDRNDYGDDSDFSRIYDSVGINMLEFRLRNPTYYNKMVKLEHYFKVAFYLKFQIF